MTDLLVLSYPWIKALHVISVIAWMAGLLYLPRLFVYHVEAAPFSEASERYKVQERRLLRAIMNPAMILVWVSGSAMTAIPGLVAWDQAWPWLKGFGILVLSVIHHVFGYWRKSLAKERRRPARHYRIANEVPTLAMILIVVMIIARPF